MASGQPRLGAPIPAGATVRPLYMGRSVMTYPVHELEMNMIGTLNAQTTLFSSFATLALGYAGSIWINAAFYTSLTPMGMLAARYIAPLMGCLAAVFALLALFSWSKRRDLWAQIKRQSAPMETEMTAASVAVSASRAKP